MRAVLLNEPKTSLRIEDIPEPEGVQLIQVRAAGLNYLDVLIRQGLYPSMPAFPYIPGSEVAGDLDGRRVIAFTGDSAGGFAERVAVDPDWTFDLPDGVSFEQGAAFLMTYVTAWIPLVKRLRIEPGQTVLVHAAAGGVGSAAIQIARHLGARVVATAGSEEKREAALKLGADEAYSYDDFKRNVRADHVLDPVGGSVFADSVSTLNIGGNLVAIGFAGGQWDPINPGLIVGRNIAVHGFYIGRLMQREPSTVRDAVREMSQLLQVGTLQPFVGACYRIDQANDALDLLESRGSVGKVVLTI